MQWQESQEQSGQNEQRTTGEGRTEAVYQMSWKATIWKERGEQSKGEMLQRSKSLMVRSLTKCQLTGSRTSYL